MIIYIIMGIVYTAVAIYNTFTDPDYETKMANVNSVWWGWLFMTLLWLIGAVAWPLFIVLDHLLDRHNSKDSPT